MIPRIPAAAVDAENIRNQVLNQYIRDLAGRNGRRLVDNFYGFGAIPNRFSTHYWDDPIDRVGHPNATGYDLMADLFRDVLTGVDGVPPVPGLIDPNNGATGVPGSSAIRVDLWDFGSDLDLTGTSLTVDGVPVNAQVSGSGSRGEVIFTPSAPLVGVVTVDLTTADLATPANTQTSRLFRFVIAGTEFLDGDVDEDGRVDGTDLVRFARAFGSSLGSSRFMDAADFDSNGVIDGDDLAVLASNFGQSSF